MLIIRRIDCINTASGIVTLCTWLVSAQVKSPLLTCALTSHLQGVTIPEAVLIQSILLMISI
jgi:hypothetical protein